MNIVVAIRIAFSIGKYIDIHPGDYPLRRQGVENVWTIVMS